MNNRQKRIKELHREAKGGRLINYYGILIEVLDVRQSLSQLDRVSDQITLLQMSNDYELVGSLINNELTDENQRALYNKLKETNSELDETINIELLADRYSFLGNLLDSFVTDIEIQQRLTSLSDERLELFKQLFTKVKDESSNPIPILTLILSHLGTSPSIQTYRDSNRYDALNLDIEYQMQQGNKLNDEEMEKLLFLYTSDKTCNVSSIEDLEKFGDKDSKDMIEIEQMVDEERKSVTKNIKKIKEALLWKSYGISLNEAEEIVSKYRVGKTEVTDDNRATLRLI